MKKLFFPLFLCLIACMGQDAKVLSSDGSKVLAYCSNTNWAPCAAKTCPNGYDVIDDQGGGCTAIDSIVKCKPESKTNVQ